MNRTDVEKFIHANFGGILQEYPWSDTPNYAVFRHQDTRKWFALLYDESYTTFLRQNPQLPKLNPKAAVNPDATVSAINLKSDPDLIEALIYQEGILPAYHMNKHHWLTILLDGSCPDAKIQQLIDLSYNLTMKKLSRKLESASPNK